MNHSRDDVWPDLRVERRLRKAGFTLIAGLDEAGRGAWAGPVFAAAVILPVERRALLRRLRGVRDSKRMTPRQRTLWAERIKAEARAFSIGSASAAEIDRQGLIAATRAAMARAVAGLHTTPDHLLIDYITLPDLAFPQTALVKADLHQLSVAAASVLAKVARDEHMIALEAAYPGYGFAQHKGYGTRHHRDALRRLGPSAIHRRSYAPIAQLQIVTAAPS